MNWIKRKLANFIIDTVASTMVIGARCGCCGAWVSTAIVPHRWRVTVCEKCVKEAEKEG